MRFSDRDARATCDNAIMDPAVGVSEGRSGEWPAIQPSRGPVAPRRRGMKRLSTRGLLRPDPEGCEFFIEIPRGGHVVFEYDTVVWYGRLQ